MLVWIWTGSASIGVLIAALNLVDAMRDLRSLGVVRNGRRIIAHGWIRNEAIRLGIQAVWAFIGILALLDAASHNAPITLLGLLFIGTNLALAVGTILDARDRRTLRRILT